MHQDFGDLVSNQMVMLHVAVHQPVVFLLVNTIITNGDNTIDYVTIASTGDAIDFGDLILLYYGITGSSNQFVEYLLVVNPDQIQMLLII